ncbi:hypothetical protein BaRGS_00001370 [Batillaria attramentaria]|uniref:Uncharacterized protein n=1 Tax=Batillaria attramentaria TaxID=370345 RepID=A0ABD0M7G4_9CAEN
MIRWPSATSRYTWPRLNITDPSPPLPHTLPPPSPTPFPVSHVHPSPFTYFLILPPVRHFLDTDLQETGLPSVSTARKCAR